MALLLWGSVARGEAHPRSDLDLLVVAGPHARRDALRAALDLIELPGASALWGGQAERPVDLKVFESLPDNLQGDAIRDHKVLWCEDRPALGEYLRPFWKRWRTQAARNRLEEEEARELLLRMAGPTGPDTPRPIPGRGP